ncbi:MAG: metallophosphoesterase [Actinomycetes bacterium]
MSDPQAPGVTTGGTVERGDIGAGGWRELVPGPAEAYQHPLPTGEVLGCIWHLSDVHLCDAESTARLEYLDRYSDPDSPYREALGDIGTYRPQEAMTVQVAVTMVETVNELTTAPVSGAPIDTVLVTGDLTDNAQRNELDWYQTLIEGGTVSPRSGDVTRSSWVGATDADSWDERYWHPDGAPNGFEADRPTRLFGYPIIPGLTEAVRRDVTSPGLTLPWISVYGNHDGLLQGTVAPDEALRSLATGEARITGLPSGADPMLTEEAIAGAGPVRYIHDETSPRVHVPRDPERDFVSPAEFAEKTRDSGDGVTYFTAQAGRLRVISLDTINPHGGWQGSLGLTQYEWLVEELDNARNEYVIIASHHPSPTLVNDYSPAGAEPRVLGDDVIELLTRHRQVIAWLAGHVHFHAALRHEKDGHAFVELTTASLIDWPQQGRILEFLRLPDSGEVAIVSTVVDHRAPAGWTNDLGDVANLASISRALAANDYRLRENSLRGLVLESTPDVRNVVWRVPDPFA